MKWYWEQKLLLMVTKRLYGEEDGKWWVVIL
jgi:hypothetical protein